MALRWIIGCFLLVMAACWAGYQAGRRARGNYIRRNSVVAEMKALDAIAEQVFMAGGYSRWLLNNQKGAAPARTDPEKVSQKVQTLLSFRLNALLKIADALGVDPVTTPVDVIVDTVVQMRTTIAAFDQRRFWDNERQQLEESTLLPGHRARMICEVEPQPQWTTGKEPLRIAMVRDGFRDGRGYSFVVPHYLVHSSLRVDVIRLLGKWMWVSYVAQSSPLDDGVALARKG